MPEKRLIHLGSQQIVEHSESGPTCQPRGFLSDQIAQEEKSRDSETAKIPAIRFRGFTDAWEQRKLREYLETSQERNSGGLYGREDVLSVVYDTPVRVLKDCREGLIILPGRL